MHGKTCLANGKVADAITAFPRTRGLAALLWRRVRRPCERNSSRLFRYCAGETRASP